MPNQYFQFKKFRVEQANSAMKVCTDACIFGAWVANQINIDSQEAIQLLDIGAGTGLLSLIVAQQLDNEFGAQWTIDAIELDEKASLEAKLNFNNSPWSSHLDLVCADVKLWKATAYDIVFCNPPFFQGSLKGRSELRNQALHANTLTIEDLAIVLKATAKTSAFVLLPPREMDQLEKLMLPDFALTSKLLVRNTQSQPIIRICGHFSRNPYNDDQPKIEEQLAIYLHTDAKRGYSEDFIKLLKPYYLNL